MKLSHSKGFTLVELLVVIAIIGVLVGLTIPAVQAVRATARQTQCLNNVKQLAAAAAAHETTLGYLPNYWGTYGTNNANGNWVVPLLPHLGEGPVWSQWENGKGSTQERYPTLSFLIARSSLLKRKFRRDSPTEQIAATTMEAGSRETTKGTRSTHTSLAPSYIKITRDPVSPK